jgi:hypothetical protein
MECFWQTKFGLFETTCFFQRTSMWFWILLCFFFFSQVCVDSMSILQCIVFHICCAFCFSNMCKYFFKNCIYIHIYIYKCTCIYAHAVSYICICTYTYRHRWIWTTFMLWHLQPFCGHTHWSHQKLLCIFDSIGDQIRSCYIKNVR